MQCLVWSAEGVEEEEAAGHRGEEDDSTTEEDDGGVEARWDGAQQVWEDWERKRGEEGQSEERLMFDGEQKVRSSTSCWFTLYDRREHVAHQQNSQNTCITTGTPPTHCYAAPHAALQLLQRCSGTKFNWCDVRQGTGVNSVDHFEHLDVRFPHMAACRVFTRGGTELLCLRVAFRCSQAESSLVKHGCSH